MTTEEKILKVIKLREQAKALEKEEKLLVQELKNVAKKTDGKIDTEKAFAWIEKQLQDRLNTKELYNDFPDIKKDYGYTLEIEKFHAEEKK